jgi:phosphoglycolate phosphatase-like HAD superfamily hydrolase
MTINFSSREFTLNDRPEAIVFDLDGTLFRTETLLLPAYEATFEQLRREHLFAGPTPPSERIISALGMLLEQIWQRVMPEASVQAHLRANELLLQYQKQGLIDGLGVLYDGVAHTLHAIYDSGIRLFIASNGVEEYVKQVPAYQGIAPLFEGLYSAGEFRTRSKVDLVRLLLDRHEVKKAWMVGDRSSDVEAGHANGLPVIGCDYAGFGDDRELADADVRIRTFTELMSLVDASL